MLRASLPDRRCIRFACRPRRSSSSKCSAKHMSQRPCRLHRSINWSHHPSHQFNSAISPTSYRAFSSSMSPKPFYDYENEDDDSPENDWMGQRSSSPMDNFSKYDNYTQYSSSHGSKDEGSLFDLLSKNQNGTLRNQETNREEESLFRLLSDKDPSSSLNSPSLTGNPAREYEEDSLMNLLQDHQSSSEFPELFGHDLDFKPDQSSTTNGPDLFGSDFNGPGRNFNPDRTSTINEPDLFGSDFNLDRSLSSSEHSLFDSDLQFSPNQLNFDQELPKETYDEAPLSDLLGEQDSSKSKYEHLQRLQLQLETESFEEAIVKGLSVWKSARDRCDHSSIPVVRNELSAWYASLTDAIELEQWMYLNGDYRSLTSNYLGGNTNNRDYDVAEENGANRSRSSAKKAVARDRTIYGPLLCLLPPQKIAILLAHTALSSTVSDGDNGSKVVNLAMRIADLLETEINLSRALRVRASKQKAKLFKPADETDKDDEVLATINIPQTDTDATEKVNLSGDYMDIDKWVYTATHLQRFLDEISNVKSGSPEQKLLKGKGRVKPALVRRRCQEILLAEGYVQDRGDGAQQRPLSMNDFTEWDPVVKVKLGAALIQLLLDHTTYSKSRDVETGEPGPAFFHARKKIGGDSMRFQGFITVHPDLHYLATKAELEPENMLLSLKFTQNARCQPMVVPPKDWKSVNDGGYESIKVDFMRTRQCKSQKDAIRNANMAKVYEGLNVLGRIPWKINKNVLNVAMKCWDEGVVLGDIPSRTDYDVPPLPEKLEFIDLNSLGEGEKEAQIKALKAYKDGITKHFRFKQKNMDLHSLRCSAMLKLNQAQKFQDFEEIFFPHNVDFRGRAYPVPPHLSIVGSDLCRALLMFAHPKPLGPNGLYWLKVHLANLAGANKMSFDGRAQFADDNMDNIREAVNNPLGGNTWWMEFDDPFQGLATCHEIIQAIDSGDPSSYMCSLPVHMDGSCNGLQHYAALGRDKVGGKAVNLCIAEKPQDVYSGVMHEVIRRVAEDANVQLPFDINKSDLSKSEKEQVKQLKSAQLVNGLIDRGVVKRTVMTSVYGVTYIGAKNQISEKIEEKLEERGHDIDEIEQEIHTACGYLASLTMEVMGQLFTGARQNMNWLTACARLISAQGQPVAFISPIGVPVVQPYRQKRPVTVVTLLQNVVLTYDSDVLPVHRQRQVSAFPPNYVHSLDSSHMLLTAIEMQKRGLYFSAVHDSYWTHSCDIEEMNDVLRESFIELYERPLLEDLKRNWELRYPSITFPDLPERGDLDLNDVRSAPYFFQ